MRTKFTVLARRAGYYSLALFYPGSRRGTRGQDLVEYALLCGFIAVAAAAAIPHSVTGPISSIFNKIDGYLKTWGNG